MQRYLPALVILALTLPVLAKAEDAQFPPRRPGLWEMTVKTGPSTVTTKQCVDHATDQKLMQMGTDALKRQGGSMTVTHDGNQFHIKSIMKIPGHTITATEDITFVSDTNISGRGHSHMDPPFPQGGPPADSDMTNDSKWTGPCPPNMQPGDVIANGRTFNVLKAPPPRQ